MVTRVGQHARTPCHHSSLVALCLSDLSRHADGLLEVGGLQGHHLQSSCLALCFLKLDESLMTLVRVFILRGMVMSLMPFHLMAMTLIFVVMTLMTVPASYQGCGTK